MSGTKHSDYHLARERALKLQTIQSIQSLRSEAGALRERLQEALAGASLGLRSTFQTEVEAADGWVNEAIPAGRQELNLDAGQQQLNELQNGLRKTVEQGRKQLANLRVAFTEKADRLGQEMAERMAALEAVFLQHEAVLKLWFAETDRAQWKAELACLQQLIDREEYPAAESGIAAWRASLLEKAAFAQQQEDKHQKRLYLLKALRQVCVDMGFEEIAPPRFEREGDRGSRILLRVDTLTRGAIDFSLTLEKISTQADMARGRCFEDFAQLTEHLQKRFGVQTQFVTADGDAVPRLLRKGELDLPDQGGASLSAQTTP